MSIISASTLTNTALQYTADTTGTLVFQTGATPTTALTLAADQSATFTGTVNFAAAAFTNLSYTGTFTGGTGVVNLGSGQFYKANGGNVLIGSTTDNGFKFKVVGGNASNMLIDNDGSQYTQLVFQRNSTSNSGGDILIDGTASTMNVRGLLAGAMTFQTSLTAGSPVERMRIDSSGNVGIGTTVARSLLTLNKSDSTGVIANTPSIVLRNKDTTDTSRLLGGIFADDYRDVADPAYCAGIWFQRGTYATANGPGNICFGTETLPTSGTPTERMRIDSSGNVLVGTTTLTGVPQGVVLANVSGTIGTVYIGHASGTASGNLYSSFYYAGSQIGSITQTGTTAVLYNTTSDYRLKTDVTPIQNALATVNALNPVNFTWTDGRKDDGFLAHEIQAIIPNCVTGEKDAVNEDGTPKYQQMDNSGVIPFLVKAIQELKAEFDEYKATHP